MKNYPSTVHDFLQFLVFHAMGACDAGCLRQVGQGGYVEWFVLQNFLYTRRHLDMHFVYYRLLTRQERRNSVAAVHAFNKDLPQKYQVRSGASRRAIHTVCIFLLRNLCLVKSVAVFSTLHAMMWSLHVLKGDA